MRHAHRARRAADDLASTARIAVAGGDQRAWRATHPLGWRILQTAGIEDRSPLQMIRERGMVDPLALRMIDAMFARSREP